MLASVALVGRTVVMRSCKLLIRNFTCELEVTNEDDAYVWINEWLANHEYSKRASRLRLNSREVHDDNNLGGASSISWTLAPGSGNHFFFFQNRLVHLSRESAETTGTTARKTKDIINIRIYSRGQKIIRQLVAEAQNRLTNENTINVFCYNHYWRKVAKRRIRTIESVVMPAGFVDNLIADATWFFGASAWYHDRGIPYRRGYLFSGPPGCGKTSLVFAMASHFKLPLYLLNLGSIKEDSDLFEAISGVPERAILLIEDVDVNGAVKSRKQAAKNAKKPTSDEGDTKSPLSMSAFLNALDGVMSKDGRLLIMTTNHPERLDAAVIRPGRIDRHETIGPMTAPEIFQMFLRFYPTQTALAKTLAKQVAARNYTVPAAKLQGIFLANSNAPQRAFDAIILDMDKLE